MVLSAFLYEEVRVMLRSVIHNSLPPQAIQHSTDHHSQEKPHAAQSLHSLQEGTPISGLRWLEQAEAFNPGSGSATAARVRISQMGSTTCEHKQSVYVKRNWSAFILDIVNPTDTGEAFWLLARRKNCFKNQFCFSDFKQTNIMKTTSL